MLKPITNPTGNRSSLLLSVCLGLYFCGTPRPADAQANRCSQRTIDRLETESDTIRDWSELRSFYHRYRVCNIDDADVTGGVGESVARLLVDHWHTLPAASRLFSKDPALEAFALAGINITDSTDDLNRIDKLASEQCPPDLQVLCHKIRQSIQNNN